MVSLFELNHKNIPYILSFDSRTGDKTYGNPLPENLNLKKIEINAGRSSHAMLLNRNEIAYEVIYLSPALVAKVDMNEEHEKQNYQTELFAHFE